jgi:IS30 family transposase
MSYTHVNAEERYVIYHLKIFKLSDREIGRRLNRSHTTIKREVARNGPKLGGIYWHEAAHRLALDRRARPRHQRKYQVAALRHAVEANLIKEWSPEMVAGRLRRMHPNDATMHVSAETIYRWIYRDAAQGGALFRLLRHEHRRRRRQRRYGSARRFAAGRVSIHERPACIATRERFGDWEGDTLEGRKGTGHITTHVERKSRYLIAARVPDKSAEQTRRAITAVYRRIPKTLRKTLTLDNGKEFTQFKRIERDTGLQTYFADPYAPWQRGTNENFNGQLRHYFPKGADLSELTDEELAFVVNKLNHRPRKCLNFQTPHEVFLAAKRGALGL